MYRQKWKRMTSEITYTKGEEGLEADFNFVLKSNFKKDDHLLLAYIYPFTYQDHLLSIQEVEEKCKTKPDIMFFEKKELGKSLEGRPLYQITISSQGAVAAKMPVCFFTCRVHCGETPASYMLQGILDLLTNFENTYTQILLDNYVFKIIPLLNPDGVARGFWRFDTLGLNLNRFYKEPSLDTHPTIFLAK